MQNAMQTDVDRQHPRLHVHSRFHSRILPEDRDIFVYLPPNYDLEPDRAYPVLYMHDGQNLFDGAPTDGKRRTWEMAQAADEAIRAGEAEPLLIVGIAHAGERRLTEYTPTVDWKLGGGKADQHGQMLVEELLPFIAGRYRVRAGAENTGLGGSSLGALATLYLGLQYPETFGRLAVLSPSVWWNHRAILSLVGEFTPRLRGRPRVWLDVGEAEGPRAVADTDLLEQKLRAQSWRMGQELRYTRIPGGTHEEASWAQRVRPMLGFLFPCQ